MPTARAGLAVGYGLDSIILLLFALIAHQPSDVRDPRRQAPARSVRSGYQPANTSPHALVRILTSSPSTRTRFGTIATQVLPDLNILDGGARTLPKRCWGQVNARKTMWSRRLGAARIGDQTGFRLVSAAITARVRALQVSGFAPAALQTRCSKTVRTGSACVSTAGSTGCEPQERLEPRITAYQGCIACATGVAHVRRKRASKTIDPTPTMAA